MNPTITRVAALAAAGFVLSATACSPQPTEVIAGDGGLASETVSTNSVTPDATSPETIGGPATTATTLTEPVTTTAAANPGCAVMEEFLLHELDTLDDMSDDEAFAVVGDVVLTAAPEAAAGWEHFVEFSELDDFDDVDDYQREFETVLAEIDDPTMTACGVPFFTALIALDSVISYECSISDTVTSGTGDAEEIEGSSTQHNVPTTDGEDHNVVEDDDYFDDDCTEPTPPTELPCFAPGGESVDWVLLTYHAIDCDSGEAVALTDDGTWEPPQRYYTTDTTPTTPVPTTQGPSEEPATESGGRQEPPTEFMTTTTMP